MRQPGFPKAVSSRAASGLFWFACLLLISGCHTEPEKGSVDGIRASTGAITPDRLVNADNTPEDWLSYGRNYGEDRYSSLDEIRKENIQELGLSWTINLGTTRGFEATPLVVDGILYVSGPWSIVYAIDTRKAEIIWTFDPEVPKYYGEMACCDVVNRGVALYEGLVYVGSLDGRLIALDASTGEKAWEVVTVDPGESYTITGAPRVYDGKVIIGNGGAEYGVRGYVTAYDAYTGKELWRFYTVPGNPANGFENEAMKMAAKTWTGAWWESGGGGTAWDAFAYDPDADLIYVGVGNGTLWNRKFRSPEGGDNLFLSSVVALNAKDGSLAWYYQTTPGDSWDFTATQQIILADLTIKGQKRKVLMQAPKNGFFYVLDRISGELISADPYVYVNWATHVDLQTGRPVETTFGRYEDQNAQIFPSPYGGHNWQPMAFNPMTQLVYIPARDFSMLYGQPKDWTLNNDPRAVNLAIGGDKNKQTRIDTLAPREQGMLLAWDPVQKKEVWRVEQKSIWNAGVMSTRDLVFQGTPDGYFVAYDATDGAELWRHNVGSGVIAAPISYMVDGKQYITVVSGWGGVGGRSVRYTDQLYPGTIYTFALGAHQAPPKYEVVEKHLINLPVDANKADVENGRLLFDAHCNRCHGTPGDGGGAIPDLAYASKNSFERFNQIVGEGAALSLGMPDFGGRLQPSQIENIKNYILSAAMELTTETNKTKRVGNH